jgi:hypothetical protein
MYTQAELDRTAYVYCSDIDESSKFQCILLITQVNQTLRRHENKSCPGATAL